MTGSPALSGPVPTFAVYSFRMAGNVPGFLVLGKPFRGRKWRILGSRISWNEARNLFEGLIAGSKPEPSPPVGPAGWPKP